MGSPFGKPFTGAIRGVAPDQVIRRAGELANSFGTDEMIFVFKYGSMPRGDAEKSMHLLQGK